MRSRIGSRCGAGYGRVASAGRDKREGDQVVARYH